MAPAQITRANGVGKGRYSRAADALEAVRERFVGRNERSRLLHLKSTQSLPGGNTRSLLHTAPFPVFLKNGEGYKVRSEDDHMYTDFVGEMTAGLLGHSHPLIKKALVDTIQGIGLNLGGTTKFEVDHAALICKRFNFGLVRFTNSGTEANLHAIAGARRHTGKRKVVVFNGAYHGGCFSFPGDAPAENCVDKEDWIIGEYNNAYDTKHKIEDSGNVAAVLVEGMQGAGPCIVGTEEFLKQVQASARKVGAVFILDEVMTSRLSGGGLQEVLGLRPDITTMGKYLGGGITFGCFGGRADIMSVYDPRESTALAHSGTFNNNTLGMIAGHVALSKIYTPEVAQKFNKEEGEALIEVLQELSQGTKMTVTGRGSLIGIHFLQDGRKELTNCNERKDDFELKELFWLEMMEEGFWVSKRGSVSLILGTPCEELERFVNRVGDFLDRHAEYVKL